MRTACSLITLMFVVCGIAHASKVGDVATGNIMSETDTELNLQIKPCSNSPETMMFSAPWKKRFVASRTCPNGMQYDEYEVEQKSQFSHSTTAKTGDVADGLVDSKTDDRIILNLTPCESRDKAQFIVFDSPFKVRNSGQIKCGNGKSYEKSSVEQLSAALSDLGHLAWQEHIDWAVANHTIDPGETNCIEQYKNTEPSCIENGGRQCLMAKAIQLARRSDCTNAFRLVLITQCHNPDAQRQLVQAGPEAVCTYLRVK